MAKIGRQKNDNDYCPKKERLMLKGQYVIYPKDVKNIIKPARMFPIRLHTAKKATATMAKIPAIETHKFFISTPHTKININIKTIPLDKEINLLNTTTGSKAKKNVVVDADDGRKW